MKYKIETERENLFDVSIVIAMRVRVEGEVVFEELEKTFKKAVAVHEILNSKIVIEDNGEAFYVDCEKPMSSFKESSLSFEELINANQIEVRPRSVKILIGRKYKKVRRMAGKK